MSISISLRGMRYGGQALRGCAIPKHLYSALIYAISENPCEPVIGGSALDWAWRTVRHLTMRMIYQASVFVHDNEFDALRQKALRHLRSTSFIISKPAPPRSTRS